LGVLLRWEAALTELRRFRAVPDLAVHDFLQAWQPLLILISFIFLQLLV
jgi:hypothetical protein